jgi:DNA-binding MarR family transcriptional regulator
VGHFDRRVRAVTLTAAGRKALEQRRETATGLAGILFDREDRSQVQALHTLLQRLLQRLTTP